MSNLPEALRSDNPGLLVDYLATVFCDGDGEPVPRCLHSSLLQDLLTSHSVIAFATGVQPHVVRNLLKAFSSVMHQYSYMHRSSDLPFLQQLIIIQA